MFCQPDFITNKIFAFLNASVDWSKKNRCHRNNFNLMCLQYSLFGSVRHNVNLCQMLSYFHFAKIVWVHETQHIFEYIF